LHNMFGSNLMLNVIYFPLCYIHDWCIQRFISHRLNLLLILLLCRFCYRLMYNLL
jgi:hypothetical protein